MFDRFVGARAEGRKRPRGLTLLISTGAHAGLFAGLVLWSFWKVEKVHAKSVPVTFAQALAPPAPPPPPPAPPKPAPPKPAPARPMAKRAPDPLRAPVATPEPQPEPEPQVGSTTDEPSGPSETPGASGGAVGSTGDVGDRPDAAVTDVPPPKVPIVAIEAQRVAGNRDIRLPDAVKVALIARGQTQVTAAVKLCLDARGTPDRVQVLGSTGFEAADAHIRDEIGAWRYRPYRVNGQAVPVCTAVTLRYQIQDR
jgi:protein TonB